VALTHTCGVSFYLLFIYLSVFVISS